MDLAKFRVKEGEKLSLRERPTDAGDADRAEIEGQLPEQLERIRRLQDAFYADGREGIVFLLQGMDASGKDSLVKHVMAGVNPQGVQVHSFKAPTGEELAHDYLWRIVRELPERGKIGIFNRSQYEDVLAVRLRGIWKTYRLPERVLEDGEKDFFQKRYRQIRDFEEYLYENGYRMVKVFLHLSKEEQRERFLERLEDPDKRWKFAPSDLRDRALFEEYQALYEEVLEETSTGHSPWYVLPADQKWYTRYLMAELVAETLEACEPRYPEPGEEALAEMARARAQLLEEK